MTPARPEGGSAAIAALLALAPTDLRPLRPVRFDGDGFGVPLDQFAPADRALLRELYAAVKGFHDAWLAAGDDPTRRRLAEAVDGDRLIAAAQALGHSTEDGGLATPAVRQVLHDVRGGGLVVLAGTAQLLDVVADPVPLVAACGSAARDHAKIMRSAVTDLDAAGRERDRAGRMHAVDGFLDPWRGAVERVGGRDVRVDARAFYTGGVAGCCLEASAVDRVVYNLVNNAARFAADGRVGLAVVRLPTGLTRWVVTNRLDPAERGWLADRTGMKLGALYRGGVTHGGTGTGLTTCADLVAAGCGLPTGRAAVEAAYLGARVVGEEYHTWFHWPAYDPGGG